MQIPDATMMMVTLAYPLAAAPVPAVEKLRNDKVVAMEFTLKPGEAVNIEGRHASERTSDRRSALRTLG